MSGFQNAFLVLDPYSFTTSSGENNNIQIYGSLLIVTPANNNDSITGLVPLNAEVAIVFLKNAHATNNLVVKYNSGSSSAGNKISTYNAMNLTIPPGTFVVLGYNPGTSMWEVQKDANESSANYLQSNPSDPTGTTNGTGLMMGLAAAFTPTKSGKAMIVVSGNIAATGLGGGSGAKTQIRYGTGTAPSNGDALTGTAVGNMAQVVNAALALLTPGNGNFTCNAVIAGLTLGTAYWIDQSLARITSGTASISGISISLIEI